jgi:hypothetical protein
MPERSILSLSAHLNERSWAMQLGADIRAQLDTGGKGQSKTKSLVRTERHANFRAGELAFDPPRCEQCRAPFTSDRMDLSQYPRWSPKRFCSETCRKRAESARARRRKLEPDDAA